MKSRPELVNQSKGKKRLSRIKGQIEGIERMLESDRYSLDIIFQVRAAAMALRGLEREIANAHIKSCVQTAIESKDLHRSQEKIQEIMDFF